jgi:DHA1 family bicyclomycin/chloramphenicol resistance-like MFS transporter
VLSPPTGARRVELIVLLGVLIACAPFSIDMYLPSLPTLAQVFSASAAATERTLTLFFLGFATGQAIFGPLADRFGRKPPLYFGLALFTVASLGCAFAPSIEVLAGLRLFQALGACAGGVTARAVVRDLFSPKEGVQVLARMILVMGTAPLLAPLVGGYVLVTLGWKAIFLILAGIGAVALIAAWLQLPETHRAEHARTSLHIGGILRDYFGILRDRAFLAYGLGAGIATGGVFGYVTGSPHVFIELYHVPAQQFGLLFGVTALGMIVTSQASAYILKRSEPTTVLRIAQTVQAVAGLALLAAGTTGAGGLYGLIPPLFVYVAMNGAVGPSSTALAMAPHAAQAGLASALLGTLGFGSGALASLAVGLLQGPSAFAMTLVVALCGLTGLTLNLTLARRPSPT